MASSRADRPYNLTHAALSSCPNGGINPTEVADRAANTVEVLMSRYAKCLDCREAINNRKIEKLLDEDD
ncbi:hypothetical protein [Yinghuangia sp. YIM S09857]|uniref:hypothetical protein n=1 Tax=Yinghuangia sp. YIM S09857 TaxID=3436929 RepID=UPI003F5333FD